MKNLAVLTHAAARLTEAPKRIDRRTLPVCAEAGCRRKVEALASGGHIDHCYSHADETQRKTYRESWDGPELDPTERLDLLSQDMNE